jgi:hypothetical protein
MRPIGRLTPPCSAGKQVRALMRLSRRRSSGTRVARLARRRSPTSSSSAPASIAARYFGPTSATRLSFVRSGTDFRPVSDFCCRSRPAGLRMQRRGPRRRGGRSRRCRSRRQSGGRANHEREMRGSRPEVTEPGGRAGGGSARKTTARRACRRVVGRLAAPTHGRPRSRFCFDKDRRSRETAPRHPDAGATGRGGPGARRRGCRRGVGGQAGG